MGQAESGVESAIIAEPSKGASFLTSRQIGHEEAREAVGRLVNSHFRKEPVGRFSIPAKRDYDDDLVTIAYIRQQQKYGTIYDDMVALLQLILSGIERKRMPDQNIIRRNEEEIEIEALSHKISSLIAKATKER